MKLSKRALSCEQSPMRKFHADAIEAQKRGTKIYHMNIGQPDIATPQIFFDAVRAFSEPVVKYAPSPGIPQMISAIQHYYATLGIAYTSDDILITTGGSEALLILMLCILDEGDEVIVPEPFYPNYNTFVRAAGGVIRPLPTSVEEGYRYAMRDRIEALINDRTRAILFSNPGNPTGVVLNHEELRMMADIAKAHDLYLIGDEVYREFVYGGEALTSIGMFEDIAQNAVVIDSVSKRFSACGARIGALITKNNELYRQAVKFCQGRLSAATLDQIAAAALYEARTDYFDTVRAEYKLRRDTTYRKLLEIPGVVCKPPEGAFYLMVKLPVDDADEFQKWLLTDFSDRGETIMFAPGQGFYATSGRGKNEIRIAYVLNQADLERAMDILRIALEVYRAQSYGK